MICCYVEREMLSFWIIKPPSIRNCAFVATEFKFGICTAIVDCGQKEDSKCVSSERQLWLVCYSREVVLPKRLKTRKCLNALRAPNYSNVTDEERGDGSAFKQRVKSLFFTSKPLFRTSNSISYFWDSHWYMRSKYSLQICLSASRKVRWVDVRMKS